ncbi:MAG: ArsR/SmtB family transcription factor [Candidatus Thorarchaeota archaeon]
MSTTTRSDQLSLVFTALSHPVRRTMLEILKLGKASASELGETFDVSAPMITKHLKMLQKAKLISRTQEAQLRYAQLNPKTLKEANDWIKQYEELWIDRFDRMENYLQKVMKKEEE